MFDKKPTNESCSTEKDTIAGLQKQILDCDHAHKLEVAEIKAQHKLDLQEKEFELKHFKDEELEKVRKDLAKEKQESAVLKKENEMLVKITDLNSDVIDVKELVSNLIEKLPNVNITGLTVNTPAS